MTVIRSPISPVIFSPLRAPTALYKGGGGLPPGYDYYVAPSVSGADDSNDGSRSSPFATHAAIRTLIDSLGASDEVSIYVEGKLYTGEHLSWNTTAASGATAYIYLGKGYVLDGTGLTTGGINIGGGSGWTISVVALGGEADRGIIQDFLQASANAIGLTGANNLTCWWLESTNNEDGCTNHTAGGVLTTNYCKIHKNTRSQIIHAGGTSVHNNDIIEGLGAEPSNLMTTVSGSITTFNNCTVIPAGTFGATTPTGAICSLAGTVVVNGGTWGDIGVESLLLTAMTNVTFNDAVIDLGFDGNNVVAFNNPAGYLIYRARSGGSQTIVGGDLRGPATTRATSFFGTQRGLLVDAGTLGVSKLDLTNTIISGYLDTAIGAAMDSTEAAALVAVAGFQIKNNAFFGNGTNIDADIVSADAGANIADNITDDPLLSLTPGDDIASWGYRPGSPCIGAGTAGGNIGFATAA